VSDYGEGRIVTVLLCIVSVVYTMTCYQVGYTQKHICMCILIFLFI